MHRYVEQQSKIKNRKANPQVKTEVVMKTEITTCSVKPVLKEEHELKKECQYTDQP
jgi:hypothetical protein